MCKSEDDLSQFSGIQFNCIKCKDNLLLDVFNNYFKNYEANSVWIIQDMCDIIDMYSMNKMIDMVSQLYQRAQLMIFWYGSDYKDLYRYDSFEDLLVYLKDCFHCSSVEIYAYVKAGE